LKKKDGSTGKTSEIGATGMRSEPLANLPKNLREGEEKYHQSVK
jgi:hypothetical protein